ncbi:MAG: LysR family transcriptional regulator [Planctomycetota bacterium]
MAQLPDPESLRCFLAAARQLNFRAAARAVHLTPAALGKRIAQLERDLGAPLFLRTTRRVALTEAGLALVPAAEGALSRLAGCVAVARGETDPPPQSLTLGTRHELGLSWVLPAVEQVERRLPHLSLDVYFGSGPDLELRVRGGEVDCAVTSRRSDDPLLDGYRLHREDYAFVGHPRLLARSPLRKDADAAAHTLVDAHRALPLFAYWRQAPGGRPLPFAALRVMGTIAAIHWLVRRRGGVAVLPRYLVEKDLRARRLVEVLPRVRPLSDHFRLMFRTDDPRRALFETLAHQLRETPLA